MTTSTIFGFPFISALEADPYTTLNEIIVMIEALATGVETIGDNSPPASGLAVGDAYIVGTSPTGAWAGRANCLAYYSAGGWRFVPGNDSAGSPITMGANQEGMRTYNRADGLPYKWNGSAWVVMTDGSGA